MKLSEKIRNAAETAGCSDEINTINAVMENLTGSKTKNIAFLGGINCGKTALINKLAGMEVRKPTKLFMDEEPLMVTFGSGEEKPGYEVIDIKESKCSEAGVAFYEIPIHRAVDHEAGRATPMLEEMDAVIYIIPAITPFTASDVENISIIANRFPMILYVSKTELLENDEEYQSAIEYIHDRFVGEFEGVDCRILDSRQSDALDVIMEGFREISLEELREFHMMRLKQQAKNIVAEGLQRQLEQLERKKKECEADKAASDAAYREQLLEWDELRIKMLEKKRMTLDVVNKKIAESDISVKEKLICQIRGAEYKKDWMSQELKRILQKELQKTSDYVMDDVRDRIGADTAWLVGEVNRKEGVMMEVEELEGNHVIRLKEIPDSEPETPGYGKMAIAAGTGFIAGGAIFSGISLIPTCIVAVPASLVLFHFLKENSDDYERYKKRMEQLTEECCDKNFAALEKRISAAINRYYENMTEDIRKFSSRKEGGIDFEDIACQCEKISGILEELTWDN